MIQSRLVFILFLLFLRKFLSSLYFIYFCYIGVILKNKYFILFARNYRNCSYILNVSWGWGTTATLFLCKNRIVYLVLKYRVLCSQMSFSERLFLANFQGAVLLVVHCSWPSFRIKSKYCILKVHHDKNPCYWRDKCKDIHLLLTYIM